MADQQGQTGQASWLNQYLRERNTFLEPIDAAEGEQKSIRRQNSEPSLSSAGSSSDTSSHRRGQNSREASLENASGKGDIWLDKSRRRGVQEAQAAAAAVASSAALAQATGSSYQHVVYDTSSSSQGLSEHKTAVHVGRGDRDLMQRDMRVSLDGDSGSDMGDPNEGLAIAEDMFASMTIQELSELNKKIPRDAEGHLTSIGSVSHGVGECVPCQHMAATGECPDGLRCQNCHFPHGKKAPKRCKPGKPKRDRYRRFVSEVLLQIEEDPDHFDPYSVMIPTSIAPTEVLRKKFTARMQNHIEYIKAQRAGIPAPPPPGPGVPPKQRVKVSL